MAIHIVRFGSARTPGEGLRIGTVRRPPRGVPKAEFASRDFYDVWFPNLAPEQDLVHQALTANDDRQWTQFRQKFRKQLAAAGPSRDLDLLAALSHKTDLAVGCYCEQESRCHRSILREELLKRGASMAP